MRFSRVAVLLVVSIACLVMSSHQYLALAPICSNSLSCVFDDIRVSALGNATLTETMSGLSVSNIGSSGDDGVRIDLPFGTTSWTVTMDPLDPNTLPDGAFMSEDIYGVLNGSAGQLLSTSREEVNGNDIDQTTTWGYSPNDLVARTNNSAGQVIDLDQVPSDFGIKIKGKGSGSWSKVKIGDDKWKHHDLNVEVGIVSFSGNEVTGKGIEIGENDPAFDVDRFERAEIYAADVPNLLITGLEASSSPEVPTLSGWGMIGLVVLLLAGGALLIVRRSMSSDGSFASR